MTEIRTTEIAVLQLDDALHPVVLEPWHFKSNAGAMALVSMESSGNNSGQSVQEVEWCSKLLRKALDDRFP